MPSAQRLPLALLASAAAVLAQPPSWDSVQRELEAGLRLKDSRKRIEAVEKFRACGEPAAVRVLVETAQKVSKRVAKLREDHERIGKKIQEESIKRLDDRGRDNKIPGDAVAAAERVLAPMKKEQADLAEELKGEEDVRDALLAAVGKLVPAIDAARRPAAVQARSRGR